MNTRRALLPLLLACTVGVSPSCVNNELMPTPNVYLPPGENPFADVPEALRSNLLDVLYVTDRGQVFQEGELVAYDHTRSRSLAYGSCNVEIGEGVSWSTLVEESRTARRTTPLPLSIQEIEERGRFPATPFPLAPSANGTVVEDPEVLRAYEKTSSALVGEIVSRLGRSDRCKDVYIFVHGYSVDFQRALIVTAELWHFLGRQGVPIAYTWPAGIGGLMGYFYDRESGEFTVHHMREFLRLLLSEDEIHGIHLLCHSRGADVVISALRELIVERKGAGGWPTNWRKIRNLVIAAPDIDLDVIMQRTAPDRFFMHCSQITVYVSATDRALGLSAWLFTSLRRTGVLRPNDLRSQDLRDLEKAPNLSIIEAKVNSGFIGHSYFHTHPAVTSDLILLLRHGYRPGDSAGRPLEKTGYSNYWILRDGYPRLKSTSM